MMMPGPNRDWAAGFRVLRLKVQGCTVALKGSIRVPLRGSFKGSIGVLGFRVEVDDRTPALP